MVDGSTCVSQLHPNTAMDMYASYQINLSIAENETEIVYNNLASIME